MSLANQKGAGLRHTPPSALDTCGVAFATFPFFSAGPTASSEGLDSGPFEPCAECGSEGGGEVGTGSGNGTGTGTGD